LGLIALVVSIVTVTKRHRGDDEGARCTGISAVVINILATIGGILLIIFYFVPLLNSYNED
jgi:putative exporter of polyketide antibiotics